MMDMINYCKYLNNNLIICSIDSPVKSISVLSVLIFLQKPENSISWFVESISFIY